MENKEKILEVKDLRVSFNTYAGEVRAVRGVDFDLHQGETLCFVGESGCGKTVTSKAILRLLQPPFATIKEGSQILFRGEDVLQMDKKRLRNYRGNDVSMIFQDPMTSLNPTMTCGKQIMESLLLHKNMTKAQAREEAIHTLELVKIPDAAKRMDDYPHQMSGGMRQRVMIAIALSCSPHILIADEPTTALDVTIQHQILKQMRSLQEEYGTSIIFITHDLGVVAELCDRVVVLYGGLVMEEAEINDLFENPLHPYTMGLLASIPGLTKDKSERLQSIPGSPPDMTKPPKGCPFASRCQFARNICAAECPPFVQVGSRQARCWLLQPDAPAEGNPLHEKLAEAERKAH